MNSAKYGSETIASLSAKLWKILCDDCKKVTHLLMFKSKNKNWGPDKCSCRLCSSNIHRVGLTLLGIFKSDQYLLNIIFMIFFRFIFFCFVIVDAVGVCLLSLMLLFCCCCYFFNWHKLNCTFFA